MKFEKPLSFFKELQSNRLATPIVYIGFAILCFLTALVLHTLGTALLNETLPPSGGIVGPIQVLEDRSVYQVEFSQNVADGQWSFVSAELLDKNKELLFSFGKEFWSESGYDSDGRWRERDINSSGKITILEAGTYFLRVNTQSSPGVTDKIRVQIKSKKGGSSLPHTIAGIIALIIGVVLYMLRSQTQPPSSQINNFRT